MGRLLLAATILAMAMATVGCDQLNQLARSPTTAPKHPKYAAKSQRYVNWKAVLMTGDNEIVAFDNGREKLAQALQAHGIKPQNIRQLTMKKELQSDNVGQSSKKNLALALRNLKLKKGDGCFVHITSHGTPEGIVMRDQAPLSPFDLHRILRRHCKRLPTVVMAVGCYTGVFNSKTLKRSRRAIYTAARDDRTSFGCGVEDVYTYWDGCLLEELPKHKTWSRLYKGIDRCIANKEAKFQVDFRSYPQLGLGKKIRKLGVFNAKIGSGKKKKKRRPKKRAAAGST